MPTERVEYLVKQYFNQNCTPEEMQELAAWVNAPGNDESIKALLEKAWQEHTPNAEMPEEMSARILSATFRRERKPSRIRYIRWAAAAAVIIVVAGLWLTRSDIPASQTAEINKIEPGSYGAILTLADGKTVLLDSFKNGIVAVEGNTSITINDGQLVYDAGKQPGTHAFNTMTTPRGRQFQLVLPDGTNVWLNAASSITYPTAFTGTERKVSVTGEVYFEVAKNIKQPFRVSIDDNDIIEVLGTHFNVNAYRDEGLIRTTLLEGSIRLAQTVLKPREQAIISNSGIQIETPDPEQVMAWKNGIFFFRNAGLPLVMKQLERWYNIDAQYTGTPPELKVTGKMDRGIGLKEILDWLSKMDVQYTMKGTTIIIHGR